MYNKKLVTFTECSSTPSSDVTVNATDPSYSKPGVAFCDGPLRVVRLPDGELVEHFDTVCGEDATWDGLDAVTCETGCFTGIYVFIVHQQLYLNSFFF